MLNYREPNPRGINYYILSGLGLIHGAWGNPKRLPKDTDQFLLLIPCRSGIPTINTAFLYI